MCILHVCQTVCVTPWLRQFLPSLLPLSVVNKAVHSFSPSTFRSTGIPESRSAPTIPGSFADHISDTSPLLLPLLHSTANLSRAGAVSCLFCSPTVFCLWLLLLLSHFSRVRLCATP